MMQYELPYKGVPGFETESRRFSRDSFRNPNFRYQCAWKPFSLAACPHALQFGTEMPARDGPSNVDLDSLSLESSTTQMPGQLLAVGSFIMERDNYIDLLYVTGGYFAQASDAQTSTRDDMAQPIPPHHARALHTATHPYFPCRIKWAPHHSSKPLLATCSAQVHIWELGQDQSSKPNDSAQLSMVLSMSHRKGQDGTAAPITSLDWNHVDPSTLGTCSLDTTCTIWNVTTGQAKTQLIAHDRQVFDMAFSTSQDVFASVGGDGSVRLFDLRNLEHSTILYETPDHSPLLRVAWNKLDHHFLLTFSANSHRIILLDTRYPSVPVAELVGHQSIVNDVIWSPHSSNHACSVGDDKSVYIWNLLEAYKGSGSLWSPGESHSTSTVTMSTTSLSSIHNNSSILNPSMMFQLEAEGNQVAWSNLHPDWITVGESKSVRWINI